MGRSAAARRARAAGLALLPAACQGRYSYMRCGDGVRLCGVLALETGLGRGYYHHAEPTVHGLWPQVRPYGDSQCVPPRESTVERRVYPCYRQAGARALWFEGHEWSSHGVCAGAESDSDFFAQVCELSHEPLLLMQQARGEGLRGMEGALRAAGMPIYSVEAFTGQIELSACAGADGRWRLAAPADFERACGERDGAAPEGACLPDRRGPRCRADADCAGLGGCLRCARSGFCTSVPLALAAWQQGPRAGFAWCGALLAAACALALCRGVPPAGPTDAGHAEYALLS